MLLSYHISHLSLPNCGTHSAYKAYSAYCWIDKASLFIQQKSDFLSGKSQNSFALQINMYFEENY